MKQTMPADPPWLSPQALGLVSLILQSHQKLFGRPLIKAQGSRLAAQELFVLDQVVLCHNGAEDPSFIYANRAALCLFQRSWQEMVGMPSRLSASQQQRLDREKFLAQVREKNCIDGYAGERINSQGKRFQIRGARLWNLFDAEGVKLPINADTLDDKLSTRLSEWIFKRATSFFTKPDKI